ncbi:hypothetical protein Dip518_000407 [Parelusimicrobium proximum]|uniref:hypothetical protein n=1 Tax=Parelusimicrobium proximum TaxID=3228953 RepID=UPI003D16E3FC
MKFKTPILLFLFLCTSAALFAQAASALRPIAREGSKIILRPGAFNMLKGLPAVHDEFADIVLALYSKESIVIDIKSGKAESYHTGEPIADLSLKSITDMQNAINKYYKSLSPDPTSAISNLSNTKPEAYRLLRSNTAKALERIKNPDGPYDLERITLDDYDGILESMKIADFAEASDYYHLTFKRIAFKHGKSGNEEYDLLNSMARQHVNNKTFLGGLARTGELSGHMAQVIARITDEFSLSAAKISAKYYTAGNTDIDFYKFIIEEDISYIDSFRGAPFIREYRRLAFEEAKIKAMADPYVSQDGMVYVPGVFIPDVKKDILPFGKDEYAIIYEREHAKLSNIERQKKLVLNKLIHADY